MNTAESLLRELWLQCKSNTSSEQVASLDERILQFLAEPTYSVVSELGPAIAREKSTPPPIEAAKVEFREAWITTDLRFPFVSVIGWDKDTFNDATHEQVAILRRADFESLLRRVGELEREAQQWRDEMIAHGDTAQQYKVERNEWCARAEKAEAERDAVRELMNVYNLGGWTDALGPMQRALKAEAELASVRAERDEWKNKADELGLACVRFRDERDALAKRIDEAPREIRHMADQTTVALVVVEDRKL